MTTTWTAGRVLLGGGITVGVAAVVAGVIVVGSPGEGRMRRLDDMRAGDLRAIMTAIDAFWKRHDRLPDSLAELVSDPRAQISIEDPDTKRTYEYRITDNDSYELCAVFAQAAVPDTRSPDVFGNHAAGRFCFPMEAVTPLRPGP